MKSFEGFDRKNTISSFESLPAGGYQLKIVNTKVETYTKDGNTTEVLVAAFDIADGEYKDYYKKQYDANTQEDKKWKGTLRMFVPKGDGSDKDMWTIKKFNTNIFAIEDSNPGYKWEWNEATLKGKVVGGLFGEEEYDVNGKTGMTVKCRGFIDINKIKSGDFKVPKPKYLDGKGPKAQTTSADNQGFINVVDSNAPEELPF